MKGAGTPPPSLCELGRNATCWDGAASSRRCRDLDSTCLCRGRERLDLHGVAKVSQAFDQGFFLLVGGTAIEVIETEVLIHRPVLEHVVDGGKDGAGNGHDGFVGAAPGFDAVELGLQIAVFLFYRRPGALHQRGFEPGTALAHAIGSTLAGTLVVAWTYAGPRDEMCGRTGWRSTAACAFFREKPGDQFPMGGPSR